MKYSPFYFHIQIKRMRITVQRTTSGKLFYNLRPEVLQGTPHSFIHSFNQYLLNTYATLLVIKFHFQPSQNLQSSVGQGKSSKQINISVILINAMKETHRLQKSKSGDLYT